MRSSWPSSCLFEVREEGLSLTVPGACSNLPQLCLTGQECSARPVIYNTAMAHVDINVPLAMSWHVSGVTGLMRHALFRCLAQEAYGILPTRLNADVHRTGDMPEEMGGSCRCQSHSTTIIIIVENTKDSSMFIKICRRRSPSSPGDTRRCTLKQGSSRPSKQRQFTRLLPPHHIPRPRHRNLTLPQHTVVNTLLKTVQSRTLSRYIRYGCLPAFRVIYTLWRVGHR